MAVTVMLSVSAQRDFQGLNALVQAAANAEFVRLTAYPQVAGVKALKGSLKGQYRTRFAGSFRMIFTLSKGTLTVVAIVDRKDAY